MIYGANGYSAQLMLHEAKRRGLTPVLAGRNRQLIQSLANDVGCPFRIFDLSDVSAVAEKLADIDLVIHCAGPFSATSAPMIEACIQAKTHYLDITGEISVFEHAQTQHQRAYDAGVILCPGVGFDVIPTDCVAKTLQQSMPDATHLTLAFAGGNALSPGTAKTSVEGAAQGGFVRENGVIVNKPNAYKVRTIEFGGRTGTRQATTIPWGDISTAFQSTGIPNIEVYMPASDKVIKIMRLGNWVKPFLKLKFVQNLIKKQIDKKVIGPDEKTRLKVRTAIWGEVHNSKGKTLVARLETPDGYDVTTTGPISITEAILNGETSVVGSTTPSLLMGASFISTLPNTSEIAVTYK